MARRKSTALVPNMIRMREELRKRLEQQAKKNDRSLNSEMVLRLEKSFVYEEKATRDSLVLDLILGNLDARFPQNSENLSLVRLFRTDPKKFAELGQAKAKEGAPEETPPEETPPE